MKKRIRIEVTCSTQAEKDKLIKLAKKSPYKKLSPYLVAKGLGDN